MYDIVKIEMSIPVRQFYVFTFTFLQFVVPDDDLLLGRNMSH